MARKTHSLALRVKHLINWPSNIRHPFLTRYIKHVFQGFIIAEPAIRSSANGVWINLTVLARDGYDSANREYSREPVSLEKHPLYVKPELDFKDANFEAAKGKMAKLIGELQSWHRYYKTLEPKSDPVFTKDRKPSLLTLLTPSYMMLNTDMAAKRLPLAHNYKEMQLYFEKPIHIKYNVVRNPLINAEILAKYVAEQMGRGRSVLALKSNLIQRLG